MLPEEILFLFLIFLDAYQDYQRLEKPRKWTRQYQWHQRHRKHTPNQHIHTDIHRPAWRPQFLDMPRHRRRLWTWIFPADFMNETYDINTMNKSSKKRIYISAKQLILIHSFLRWRPSGNHSQHGRKCHPFTQALNDPDCIEEVDAWISSHWSQQSEYSSD